MVADYALDPTWEDTEDLHELLNLIREIRPTADVRRIRYAYFLAEQAHQGQLRSTGEPYITHPVAVAKTLAELRMDDDTIVAALLHDVLEDCSDGYRVRIEEAFGPEILDLVEGVTKLRFDVPAEVTGRQRRAAEVRRMGETMRKMLLAMAKDYRVMVIKLADRLHNMRTIEGLPPEKQARIANETLEVYAPLAARLGIWQVKWRLEDLAFKVLHPDEYRRVEELVNRSRSEREADLQQAIVTVKEALERRGIVGAEVEGRPKHLYSIFNKMAKHGFHFDDILDLLAIRIILEREEDCYPALGVVHALWMPLPQLFTDYIANPKTNGYQSLHTKVYGPRGEPLEVQIRSRAMHEVAEYGVAAHADYKEGRTKAEETARLRRLREQLFNWSSDARTSSDFLRSLSTDLFSEQVFVFTPKGDVIDLPKDSTPVDFAFRVHTDVGLHLVGAKVNGMMSQLNTKLKNGDVVELIDRSNAQPSLDWLEFVKSSHARSKIRAHFRKLNRDSDASRGRDALSKELKAVGIDPKVALTEETLESLLEHYEGCGNVTDLLAKIGHGTVAVGSVVNRIRGVQEEARKADVIQTRSSREGKLHLAASGVDNVMLKRAKCCDPVPGDEVVGYVTRGRGIMVHRRVCPNAQRYLLEEPERLLSLDWPEDGSPHSVVLKMVTVNRQGLLMDVSTVIGESRTNVVAANIRTLPNHTAEITVTVEVTSAKKLDDLINKLNQFSDVISVSRQFGRRVGK